MHRQDFAMVKALVAVAWADGQVVKAESEVLEALLDAYRATPSERAELRSYATIRRSLQDIDVGELAFHDRKLLLQHAVLLTFVDGEQDDRERELIDELVRHLHLPAPESQRLIEAAERRARELLPALGA